MKTFIVEEIRETVVKMAVRAADAKEAFYKVRNPKSNKPDMKVLEVSEDTHLVIAEPKNEEEEE